VLPQGGQVEFMTADRLIPRSQTPLQAIPFFDEQGVKLLRILTNRGTEYCGDPERHEYEEFNRSRPHQGRWCFGKTPMQTFLDAKPMAEE
jgi:hypothetical protein